MPRILKVDEICDDMVLAEPVVNRQGQLLCASGTVLEERHKKIFKIWGIPSVSVKTDEEEKEQVIPEIYLNQASEELYSKIDWEVSNDLEREILEIAVNRRAKSIFESKLNV